MDEQKRERLYVYLAQLLGARARCKQSQNTEWFETHTERILGAVKRYMPSGCGFDAGTTIDLDASHENKLVFHTSYHHMNDTGMYDGWTDHTVTVSASLAFGFTLRISGRNRNEFKEHAHETFDAALNVYVDVNGMRVE